MSFSIRAGLASAATSFFFILLKQFFLGFRLKIGKIFTGWQNYYSVGH